MHPLRFYQAQITRNYDYSTSELPLKVNYAEVQDRDWDLNRNDLLSANTVSAFSVLGYQSLSIGKWEDSLLYAEWAQRWIDLIERSGKKPERTFPGYYDHIRLEALLLRAKTYLALGLTNREEHAIQEIVDLNSTNYGGRRYHTAYSHLAYMKAVIGRAHEVDMNELEKVERDCRGNKHMASHSWQYIKC